MIRVACAAVVLLTLPSLTLPAPAGPDAVPTEMPALTSKMEHGVVTLVADPLLGNGRLILKVVAFNSSSQPATLTDDDIQISTAAGKPVQILSIDRLIDEARRAAEGDAYISTNHDPSNYSHPEVRHSGVGGSGAMEVDGISGMSAPTSGVMSPYTRSTHLSDAQNTQLQAEIDNLNTAILQSVTIAPASADGGHVVTEKPHFGRKDERMLHLVVNFNGDTHEFNFALPAAN